MDDNANEGLTEEEQKFYVSGAGHIIFSLSPNCETGGAEGFSFCVTWGRYGEAGGVLDIKEAKFMADFIYKKIKELNIKQVKK